MASRKWSEFDAGSALAGTEELVGLDTGVNKRWTFSQVATYVAGTLATALGLKAPLASPTFTGAPAAPTAAPGTNTTQLATTAFVAAGSQPLSSKLTAISAATPIADGPHTVGANTITTVGGIITAIT